MALENLEPATRIEEILDGGDITPATRLEYFLKAAANEVPKPEGAGDAGKIPAVNSDGDGYALAEGLLLPVPDGSGDAGKIAVVNSDGDGYELESPKVIALTIPASILTALSTFMTAEAPTIIGAGVGTTVLSSTPTPTDVPAEDAAAVETAFNAIIGSQDKGVLYVLTNNNLPVRAAGLGPVTIEWRDILDFQGYLADSEMSISIYEDLAGYHYYLYATSTLIYAPSSP